MSAAGGAANTVQSYVPARMDRLPWSRFHWLVVLALGITWILDGLEVTVVGNIAGRWTDEASGLGLSSFQAGAAASIYLAGACIGAIGFSYLTDKYGRKKLFLITLATYLIASFLTAFSPNFAVLAIFRFIAGAGIGGEYSAIYSAVDELIPARFRGQVALTISGSYWIGAMFGSALSIVLLNEAIVSAYYGWRIAFLLGGILGLAVLLIRRYVPESPRWLAIHNQNDEAEQTVADIERQVERPTGRELPPVEGLPVIIDYRDETGFASVFKSMFKTYPKRTILGLTLLGSQAFLYNAIFFTYGLILTNFYGIDDASVGYYIFPFAVGNVLGPWLLGRLFDTVGRIPMISGCYLISGVLLAFTGYLFAQGALSAITQTILWCIIFFFASAAASAAYLTVSEVFPMEIRALAIAIFYAIGTGIGGVAAPAIFGYLIEGGDRGDMFIAYRHVYRLPLQRGPHDLRRHRGDLSRREGGGPVPRERRHASDGGGGQNGVRYGVTTQDPAAWPRSRLGGPFARL